MTTSNLPHNNQKRPASALSCQRVGGCPAMAYHTYHDIDMPDPECLVNLKKAV